MRTLRETLRRWLAVPEPFVMPEPAVEYSAAELAAFDAAEIVVIHERSLAEPYTVAELCRRYLAEHERMVERGLVYAPVDLSHNKPANVAVRRILARVEVTLAEQNLAAAKARAKEVK